MQLSDRSAGLALVGLGALAFLSASRLPPMAGQPIGPSMFPMLIGASLALCGVLIALRVGRSFEDEADADLAVDQAPGDVPLSVPRFGGLRALVPIAALLFYVVAVDLLGFLIVGAAMILAVSLVLGARPRTALLLAIGAPPIVHLLFAKLLRVPLPAGLVPLPW